MRSASASGGDSSTSRPVPGCVVVWQAPRTLSEEATAGCGASSASPRTATSYFSAMRRTLRCGGVSRHHRGFVVRPPGRGSPGIAGPSGGGARQSAACSHWRWSGPGTDNPARLDAGDLGLDQRAASRLRRAQRPRRRPRPLGRSARCRKSGQRGVTPARRRLAPLVPCLGLQFALAPSAPDSTRHQQTIQLTTRRHI